MLAQWMSVTAAIQSIVCYPQLNQLKQQVSRRQVSPDLLPSIERFEMRNALLCTLLLAGLSSPASGQQLKEITNSIGVKLLRIPAGSFTMGSPKEAFDRLHDESPHEVILSKSYYLGVYEVTQGQFEKVMGNNSSHLMGSQLPVDNVSWHDAVSFCKNLSELPEEKATGRVYRLPTEAEWEYACRTHWGTAYCFGDSMESLGEYAWFDENSEGKTHPVGEKKPSRWGLYDMHGNVFEWCQDCYLDYPKVAVTDPQGPSENPTRVDRGTRVFRGGAWNEEAPGCRSAIRCQFPPQYHSDFIGFRIALSPPVKQSEAVSTK